MDRQARERKRIMSRAIATSIDAAASLSLAGIVAYTGGIAFWPVAGMVTVMYYTAMTIAFGVTPGATAQTRIPSPASSSASDLTMPTMANFEAQ